MKGKDLGEHPDLLGIQILELLPGLVERLCVVGMKPHLACFAYITFMWNSCC